MIQKQRQPGESVLFALVKNGKVLCEEREWDSLMSQSIPGGKMDSSNTSQPAALLREMKEELNVIPLEYKFLGDIWFNTDEWVFHVYVITEWDGKVPAISKEDFRALTWLDPSMLKDNLYMICISEMMRNYFGV